MAIFSGTKLQLLRSEKGMTQKQLAEKLGVTASSITKYERNERQPEPAVLEKILDLFDVSLDYLFERSGERNAEKLLIEQNYLDLIDRMEKASDPDIKKLLEQSPFFKLQENLKQMSVNSRKQAIDVLNAFLHILSNSAARTPEGKFHEDIFISIVKAMREISQLSSFYFESEDPVLGEPFNMLRWVKTQTQARNNINILLDELLDLHLKRMNR